MTRRTGTYEVVAANLSTERLVPSLVRHLAEAVSGRVTYDPAPGSGRLESAVTWPEPENPYPERAVAGNGTAPTARESVAGGGVVTVAEPRRWGATERAALRRTATWIGAAVRAESLRVDWYRAEEYARTWQAELATARNRLAEVRELERRRLVRAITTTTLTDLGAVRHRLRRLRESVVADPTERAEGDGLPELVEVRNALEGVLDGFRAVARGVYPSMLPDRGPRAALEELAGSLRRPVRFRGDLGRRVEWHIEAGLYQAVAAVLNTLAGGDVDNGTRDDLIEVDTTSTITVEFGRDDALRARIDTLAHGLSVDEVRASLDYDAERLAVLGGAMECVVDGDAVVVAIRLAERPAPVGTRHPPLRFEHNALYRSVWELVRQGQDATADRPDRPGWDGVADRMTGPIRLAVVRDPAAGGVCATHLARASALNVTLLDAEGPADETLAARFLAEDGPTGSIDAVLCRTPPTPTFRATLRHAARRVLLSESADLMEYVRTLVARGPVIAARRAILEVRELASRLPREHPVRWSLDRIAAGSHEFAELDLLDELEHGDPRPLTGVDGDTVAGALLLLGGRGTDPRVRLGLSADATDEQVRAAALRAAELWRARADRPATGGRDRAACAVLVRTAEGLVNAVRNP